MDIQNESRVSTPKAPNKQARMKKRRRRRRRYIIARVILWILLIAFFSSLVFGSVFAIRMLSFNGSWMRHIDLNDEFITNASIWMSEVEGIDIDRKWVESKLSEINSEDDGDKLDVSSKLTIKINGLNKGSYIEEVDSLSYSECKTSAYSMLGNLLKEAIKERLIMIGYSDSISNEEVAILAEEALGMSVEQYLMDSTITIIPSYEELASSVNKSGSLKIEGDTFSFNDVSIEYTKTKDTLVLSEDNPVVYRKQVKR